ncbi:MAG: hypothetical protein SNG81_03325 [Rikenellaceae bacterium]
MSVEWRVPSNLEIQLSQDHNWLRYNRYFELHNYKHIPKEEYGEITYFNRDVHRYVSNNIWDIYSGKGCMSASLFSFIEDGLKHIILYADAQVGKTTEISHLANQLNNIDNICSHIFNLKQYSTKQTLEEIIDVSNRYVRYKIGVLILDGLDEIPDSSRDEAINEIELIKEHHPDLYIIVTCRSNFEYSNELNGFSKLYLNQLNWNEAKLFAEFSLSGDLLRSFVSEVETQEYYEFTRTPFLLNETIEYFKETNSLPSNKSAIYERCIDKALLEYKSKCLKSDFRIIGKMRNALERIAFCMVLAQKQELTYDEICDQIDISETVANQLKFISLINISSNNGEERVSFVHNSFKEHMAAMILSKQTIDDIKIAICYNGTELIKPTMYNTAISLLSIFSSENSAEIDFVQWLANDSTRNKILVEFGNELTCNSQKFEIFKNIYNEYKGKGLWCEWGTRLGCEKLLMKFCNTKESIDFLFNELDQEATLSINKINALRLLRHANLSLYQQELTDKKDFLLSICSEDVLNLEHGEYLFYVFKNECIFEEKLFAQLFEVSKDSTNKRVRDGLCRMITKLSICDCHIEWIFRDYQKFDHRTTLIGISDDELCDYFKCLTKPTNIVRAIDYACNYIDRNRFSWRTEKSLVEMLFERLIEYGNESTVDILLANLKKYYYYDLPTDYSNGCRMYFSNIGVLEQLSNTYLKVVDQYLNNKSIDNKNDFEAAINVISICCTKIVVDRFLSDSDISDNSKEVLCSHLHQSQMLDSGVLESICNYSDYFKSRKTTEQLHNEKIELLLNTSCFVEDVRKAIEGYDEINLHFENIRTFIQDRNPSPTVIEFLKAFKCKDTYIVKTAMVYEKSGENIWLNYYILSKLPHPRHDKRFKYSKQQLCRLREIVLCSIDSKCLMEKSILLIAEYKLDIDEDRLISLLAHSDISIAADNSNKFVQTVYFLDYISKNVNHIKIIDWINTILLGAETHSENLWCAIAKFIVSNKINTLYSHFNDIINKSESQEYRFRIIMIVSLLERDGLDLIEQSLISNLSDSYKLYYYREILFPENDSEIKSHKRNEIKEYIENMFEHNLNEDSLNILLSLGSEKGLVWGLCYAKDNPEWISRTYFTSLHRYSEEHIDMLIEYFNLALTVERHKNAIQDFLFSTISVLQHIAYNSEELRDRISTLFANAANEYNMPLLHRYAESTVSGFYENNSGVIALKDALGYFNSLK